MGWFKDTFNSSGAERDRYEDYFATIRAKYPKMPFSIDEWNRKSSSEKEKECEDLRLKTVKLRFIYEGMVAEAVQGSSHRVKTRQRDAYGVMYKEYKNYVKQRGCSGMQLDSEMARDKANLEIEKQNTKNRIDAYTSAQNKKILVVGGLTLVIGAFLIIRKI